MHWMDARALRRKDAFRGERQWGDTVCDPWISDRETSSNLFQSLSKVFTSFLPGFVRFVVDWMMEKPASPLTFYLVKGAMNCNCEKVGRSGQRSTLTLTAYLLHDGSARKWEQRLKPLGVGAFQRGERPTKIGYSWFFAKSISVERMMSMARDPKSRGKQPRSYAKVLKQSLSGKGSDRAMTTRRWAWKQPSFEESVIAHWSSSMAPKMYQGSSDSPKRRDLESCFFKCEDSEVGEHSAQRANMPGSGSAHLLTPFEALFSVRFSFRMCRSASRVYKPFSFQCSPFESSVGAFILLIRCRAAKLVWKNCCAAGNPSLYKFSDEVFEQNFDRREVRMKQKQREMEKAKEPMRPSVVPCGVEGAKDLAGVFEKDLHLGCSLLTLGQLIGKPTDRATKRPTEREDHWEEIGAVDQVDGFVKRFFLDNFSLLVRRGVRKEGRGTQKDRLATGRKVGIDFEVGVLFPYLDDGKSGLPRLLQCLAW
ncbi:hypothetical protein V6N12_013733 [Hibiscus sabdariffa]|uniref:Uncharacterized protein n=1 Tax=Hibiscus sabdariffa TaxID=183260 RepID=A0ABR2CVJ6_9ROSI